MVADGNARLVRELWIERFPNRAILYQRTYTSVIPSSVKITIVAVTGPKEYCKAEEQILKRLEEDPDISAR